MIWQMMLGGPEIPLRLSPRSANERMPLPGLSGWRAPEFRDVSARCPRAPRPGVPELWGTASRRARVDKWGDLARLA